MASTVASKRKSSKTTGNKNRQQITKAKSPRKGDGNQNKHESFRLPGAWQILFKALAVMRLHWKIFSKVAIVYLAFDLILVQSVATFDVAGLKGALNSNLTQGIGLVAGGFSVFASLFSSAASGSSSDATGAFQFFLIIFMSLVIIWVLRQVFALSGEDNTLTLRQALYASATPMVPFVLLFLLMLLQLIPMLVGSELYAASNANTVSSSLAASLIFLAILLGTMALSLLWLSRTIVALYAVTVPGIYPMRAYRQAKNIVRGHRLSIIRKLLFLPLVLFLASSVVIVPIILLWAALAQWVFWVLTSVGFVLVHSYLFVMYRELIRE